MSKKKRTSSKKKAKVEAVPVSTKLHLIDNVDYGTSRYGDPDDRWDGDDTWESHDPEAFEISEHGYDVIYPGKVEPGDELYFVYAIYGTGDSFSHQDGCMQMIDVFKTEAKAEACAKTCREYSSDKYQYSLKYRNEVDTECTCYCSWLGYFESLDGIYVRKLPVRA